MFSTSHTHYDIAIIGSGAGGGTLAYALANSGKRIVILERGGFLPREKQNWDATAVFVDQRYHTTEIWTDKDNKPIRPGTGYNVGGNTKVWGGALMRLREGDFGEVVHFDGVSPAWPLSYADFAPYYTQAEALYGVHGTRGSDPTEPPADAPYTWPAVSHEPRIQEVYDGLTAHGYHPFPLPQAIRLDEANPHLSACIKCDTYDGYPCLVEGKYDAQNTCVIPALRDPNVDLVTGAYVARLETDATGRTVTGIVVEQDGETMRYTADIVVVAGGAINSAALLLRSANTQHPHGLANRSDQVGRNYMCHNDSAVLTISSKPNPSKFTKTIGLNDYYWDAPDFPYPLGHIQSLGKSSPPQLHGEGPAPSPALPIVGMTLEYMTSHSVDWWMTTEDLPRADNRVTLNPDGSIRLAYTPNNLEPHKRLGKKLHEAMERIEGGTVHLFPHVASLSNKVPITAVAHQCGTCRFGADPDTTVLDLNCKAHDLDNLYVVDSSFFPANSSVNPSLTIIANALRVADHLRDRMQGKGK